MKILEEDFHISESLTIFFLGLRRLIFRAFRSGKVQKSAREFSDGQPNIKVLIYSDGTFVMIAIVS